jgi:4-amino-4-deoxy-L-arabinose transferase-like glycosyltransferase
MTTRLVRLEHSVDSPDPIPHLNRSVPTRHLGQWLYQTPVAWLRRWRVAMVLIFLVGWYSLATLPYLDNFPRPTQDETQIAAPAYKLATQGIYGQDLYTGYYHSERYVYEFLPLHPLLLALCFKLFGLGMWQARLVSVFCGLATVLLTYDLGRRLYGAMLGLLAAAFLCVARLSLEPQMSGIPLLDFARVIRYDIVVPVGVLLSCICFYQAHLRGSHLGYLVAGVVAGLATLGHVYGAFILMLFAAVLVLERGWRVVLGAPAYLLGAGWALVMSFWLIYALQDPAAYYGQTLFDQAAGRYDVLDPAFYWSNLLDEISRYHRLFGTRGTGLIQPRVGIWLLIGGVLGAYVILLRRVRRGLSLPDRLLFLSVIVLFGLQALLINIKDYRYIILLLPFFALQVAFTLLAIWQWAGGRARWLRWAGSIVLAAAFVEAVRGVTPMLRNAHAASSYHRFTDAVAQVLPPKARVLMVHYFWIGLAQYDVRSLDLPFRLTNPNLYKPHPLSMEQALQQIAPQYLLVDPPVEKYVFDPVQPGDSPILLQQKQALTQALHQHCATLIATVDGPAYADYGPMKVYRCDWP